MPITDPAEEYFKDGLWGWDGAAWRKLPLLWGYSAQYLEYETVTAASTSAQDLTFSTVPAGELWVVTSVTFYCNNNSPTRINLSIYDGTTHHYILMAAYPVANRTISVNGPWYLIKDDYLRYRISSVAIGAVLHAYAFGYKMIVPE